LRTRLCSIGLAVALAVPAQVSFVESEQKLGEGSSWQVQLVDLNGDGRLDAYFEGGAWINDGTGKFSKGSLSLCAGGTSDEVPTYFTDVDSDGFVDALCGNRVFLNDGRFHFADGGAVPTKVAMNAARLADLNGDGRLDLIVADQSEDRVLLNDGRGNFRDTGKGLGGWGQCTYAVGDVNGDGFVDVYVGIPHTPLPNMGPANDKLWLGNGKGGFTEARLRVRTNATRGVALADFNGDGRPDLFIASQTGPSRVLFNDGKGGFADTGQLLGEAPGGKTLVADFDGDGFLDVFVARGGPLDNGIPNLVWLNDGRGRFTDSGLRLGNSNSIDAAIGDLDGDGRPDVFVANIKNVMTKKGPGFNEVWLSRGGTLNITYIANEGFLLESDGKKVLIDALMIPNPFGYDSPSIELLGRMEAGTAPFGGVGAVLATHPHADHFTAKSVAAFLARNSGSVFLSTRDAVEQVRQLEPGVESRTRIASPERLRESRRETVGSIEIDALRFSHGRPAYENLAYLVRLNGFTVLHSGDSMDPEDYQAYPWDAAGVDVAIVNWGLFNPRSRERFVDALKNRVKARNVVLMHYVLKSDMEEVRRLADDLRSQFERVIVFSAPMESVSLERSGGPGTRQASLEVEYTYFLGGSGADEPGWLRDPILDEDGKLYLAGSTTSADFPITENALYKRYGGGNKWGPEDAFFAIFDTRLKLVEYTTFLGGAGGPDFISNAQVGGQQRIYVTGNTGAPDFPVTGNAYLSEFQGPDFRHADGFFAVLGESGRKLEYASLIGGSGNDWVQQVFIEESGGVTLFGITESPGFPSPQPPRATGIREGPALFRLALDPRGERLTSSQLVGNSWEFAVKKLKRGGFVVVGTTNNPNFATTEGAWDRSYNEGTEQNGGDLFALWTTAVGEVTASTLFGGSGEELSPKIAAVNDDDVVIVGRTRSKDLPVTSDALLKTPVGANAAFLARLDGRGRRLAYCTYLSGEIHPRAVVYDGRSRLYITGDTRSSAPSGTSKGGSGAFVLVFNLLEKRIEHTSYFDGSKDDSASELALGPGGAVYVIGTTNSDDFPVGNAPLSVRRGVDIFISKLTPAQ
jgi:L-ascorbate metabolism protein UlaG (beta-lactamase superfamily)